MHLYVRLAVPGKLQMPIHYNHMVQAIIYHTIDPELSLFLHERGFVSGGRIFKLFAVSRIFGKMEKTEKKGYLTFSNSVSLVVSSPVEQFCQSIANGLLMKGVLQFGSQTVQVTEVQVEQPCVSNDVIYCRTLSPVVAYSTLLRPDGRKYTCYFQPGDPDYNKLVEGNLRKKYQAFYGIEAPIGEVQVESRGGLRQNIVKYKETIIKGYTGKIRLTGPMELLQIAVDAGIGSKNSQGFGCIEMEKPHR